MLRYCTGVSEGLHSLQCYCPRLRHPEVINGLWGLPSRTPPRQKTLGWKSGTPLGCFTSAPRSRQKTLPLPSRVAAGKGTEERAGVCTCPPPRVVSHSRDGNGNGPGVAAERAPAPTRWQQEKSRLHLSLSCFHSIGVGVSSAESPPPLPPSLSVIAGGYCKSFLSPLWLSFPGSRDEGLRRERHRGGHSHPRQVQPLSALRPCAGPRAHTAGDVELLGKPLCEIPWMLTENVCRCLGAPSTRVSRGGKGGGLSAGISGLAHQFRSFIRPETCQRCISHPRLFSNGGCHFSVRGAKRDLFGIQNIIFYGFWLYCCFDSIILLQELGAKAGDIFQSASLRKYHNKLSCQCGSCTCAKTCMLQWLWKMSKKGGAD